MSKKIGAPKAAYFFILPLLLIAFLFAGRASARHGHRGEHRHMGGASSPSGGLVRPGESARVRISPYFSEAISCAFCHNGLRDEAGSDISIESDWGSTMMANSARDPLWRAKVESEVLRNPGLRAQIEGRCSLCHTPMASSESILGGNVPSLLNGGLLDAGHSLHRLAVDGVSCTLCHQIEDAGLGTKESYSGGYSIDRFRARPNRAGPQ